MKKANNLLLAFSLLLATSAHAFDLTTVFGTRLEQTKMTYLDARMIFTGKTNRWVNGEPVFVFILPRNNPSTALFLSEYIGLSPAAFYDIVNHYNQSGKTSKITIADSETDLIIKMRKVDGCIGYIGNKILIKNFNEFKEVTIQ